MSLRISRTVAPTGKHPALRQASLVVGCALVVGAAAGVLAAQLGSRSGATTTMGRASPAGEAPSDGPVADVPTAPTPEVTSPQDRPVDDPSETGAGPRADGAVLMVGDSVLALIADELDRHFGPELHVDGVPCRRLDTPVQGCGANGSIEIDDGLTALRSDLDDLAAVGIVPETVVLVLANNSSLVADDVEAAMDELDDVAHVWWVNTRIVGFGRQDENNRLLDELAADDDRVGVVDWFDASDGRRWLQDHVHPNDDGQAALAALIARRVRCGCTA